MFPKNAFTLQKFPNHKTIEDPDTTEHVLENLYPNTLYHVWVAAKSRRGEGAATPKLSVRTEQYGESCLVQRDIDSFNGCPNGLQTEWEKGVTFNQMELRIFLTLMEC